MKNKGKVRVLLSLLLIIIVLAIVVGTIILKNNPNLLEKLKGNKKMTNSGKLDDWEYEPSKMMKKYNKSFGLTTDTLDISTNFNGATTESTLGYSTGGAKDVNNFRENIKNDYFPIMSDLTYEGIFYDYHFETGKKQGNTEDLFYPSYSTAISKDPISNEEEYYMSVGLNSNIKESDFKRKKLNLVVALDISGSMSSGFSSYYYDMENDNKEMKSKMQLANESLNILIDNLNEDDSLGVVLFESEAHIAKPLNKMGDVDIAVLKDHILEIEALGGTNFEDGYKDATELFEEYKFTNSEEYENRIIVITDAMPNYGETSKEGLLGFVEENSQNGIYTTFIGVGVDFNTELIKKISSVRGGNYYSVSDDEEFKARMGEEFEYMVTPIVFDLNLDLESQGFEIEAVYGTDDSESEKGNIMHVNSLFPSKSNENDEVKGGLILLKLKKTGKNSKIELKVSYEDRNGNKFSNSQDVEFNISKKEYYDNTGIRKGIVLSRYVNTLKNWIAYERTENPIFLIGTESGIIEWKEVLDQYALEQENDYKYYYYSENERASTDLSIGEEYKQVFTTLKSYIEKEIPEVKDYTLKREIEILEKLINF